MAKEYLDKSGLSYFWGKIKSRLSLLSGSTELASGTDLNTVTAVGNYAARNNNIASSLINSPISTWFHMRVGLADGVSPTYCYQEIIHGATGQRYYRCLNGGTWTLWQTYLYKNDNNTSYTALASNYTGSPVPTYWRIRIPNAKTVWTILGIELSLIQNYSLSSGGKIFIDAYHSSASPYVWTNIQASCLGHLSTSIKVFASDGEYFYIQGCGSYTSISVDKILASDAVRNRDISNIEIDIVSELPEVYQTATMHYSEYAKRVVDSNDGGTIAIAYSKAGLTSTSWLAGWNGYELRAISPANVSAGKVNGHTVNADVPSDAVFTDTTYPVATYERDGLMSANDKSKLNGIATGAEVNQNAFSNVKVGSTTVAADAKTDTLELVAGSNVTLTPDATNDKVTIAATDTTYSAATVSTDGLMSANDKVKLSGIASYAEVNQNAFSNVKVGSTTIAADGKTDTLELDSSFGIDITPDATNDKVTIGVNGSYIDAAFSVRSGAANGICPLDANAKIDSSYISNAIISNIGTVPLNGNTTTANIDTNPAAVIQEVWSELPNSEGDIKPFGGIIRANGGAVAIYGIRYGSSGQYGAVHYEHYNGNCGDVTVNNNVFTDHPTGKVKTFTFTRNTTNTSELVASRCTVDGHTYCVMARVKANASTAEKTIGTIPAAYAPPFAIFGAVTIMSGNNSVYPQYCYIRSDGGVVLSSTNNLAINVTVMFTYQK